MITTTATKTAIQMTILVLKNPPECSDLGVTEEDGPFSGTQGASAEVGGRPMDGGRAGGREGIIVVLNGLPSFLQSRR